MPTSYYKISADDCEDIVSAIKEKGGLIADRIQGSAFANAIMSLNTTSKPIALSLANKTIKALDCGIKLDEIVDIKSMNSVSYINMPNVYGMKRVFFDGNSNLTSVNLPNVRYVDNNTLASGLFTYCSNLSIINMPNLERLSTVEFINGYCTALSELSLPKISEFGNSFFKNNNAIRKVRGNPNGYGVGTDTFANARNLLDIDFENIAYIWGQSAFYDLGDSLSSKIESANFEKLSTFIGSARYGHFNYARIKELHFPALVSCSGSVFEGLYRIEKLYFENPGLKELPHITNGNVLSYISAPYVTCYRGISGLPALTSMSFPMLNYCEPYEPGTLNGLLFIDCSGLTSVTFNRNFNIINYNLFSGCPNVSAINLLSTTVNTYITNSDQLNRLINGTKIASGEGYIYVPSNLYSDYLTAWSWASSYLSIYGGE